jgi:cobalt/nickel transport system ATP-binding protein
MKLIELKNICYTYPDGTRALKGINMSIGKGKKIAVLGPNGSGKSTLFLVLNGLYRHEKGDYFFNGEKVVHSRKQQRELIKNIGIVFQDPDIQLFASTVFQEISIGPKNLGLCDDETRERIGDAMEQTDVAHLSDRPTHFLSYGEKKRVAIADILAMKPDVVVLDEPLAWLDNTHEKEMIKILELLNEKEKTIILSTHSPDTAYEWADYIYILKDGAILGEGTPVDVFLNKPLMSASGLDVPFILKVAEKAKLKRSPVSRNDLLSMLEEE